MSRQFYSITFLPASFLLLLVTGAVCKVNEQTLSFSKAVANFTTGGTDLATYICNQSRIPLLDANGNSIFINSDDTAQAGSLIKKIQLLLIVFAG